MNANINFESIIKLSPGYIYWKDLNSVYLGCNQNLAQISGLDTPEDIIGKTDYDFFWGKKNAAQFIKDDKHVIKTRAVHISEYALPAESADEEVIIRTEKSPLFDHNGQVIGVLGVATDMTAERKAEQLKLKNETYVSVVKEHEKFKLFINDIQQCIQAYKITLLNDKAGLTVNYDENETIKLTKREYEVLYLLSIGKSTKEIASFISKLEGKKLSHATIDVIINKQLYPKFQVFNRGQLIEKATLLKIIPFIPDSF